MIKLSLYLSDLALQKNVIDYREILQLIISQVRINSVYLTYIKWFLKRVIVITHSVTLSKTELLKVKSAAIVKTV